MDTVVYKVSGPYTQHVYYGYSTSASVEEAFFNGSDRTDAESSNRGDYRMLAANKHDKRSLKFELVDIFDSEYEAWCVRNDLRATDPVSITGPTQFPAVHHTKATKEFPLRSSGWFKRYETAREAYENGVFTPAEVAAVCANHGRKVVEEMYTISPATFSAKYLS